MATERKRLTGREILIGLVVLIPVFLVIFLGAGALNLPVPQWLLSGISALVGVVIWFVIIGRIGGKK